MKSPSLSRTLSRESFARRGLSSSRKNSAGNAEDLHGRDTSRTPALEEIGDDSVDAETAGLGLHADTETQEIDAANRNSKTFESYKRTNVAPRPRPRSLLVNNTGGLITPVSSNAGSPNPDGRTSRSRSQPPPGANATVADDVPIEEEYDTPPEERPTLETMYENDDENDTGTDVSRGARIGYRENDDHDVEENHAEGRFHVAEIYEGQGTYERPKLTTQRPRRKPGKEGSSNSPTSPDADGATLTPTQNALSTQGVDDVRVSDSAAALQATRRAPPGRVPSVPERATDRNISRRNLQGQSQIVEDARLPERTDSREGLVRESYQTASSRYSDSTGVPISVSDGNDAVSHSRRPSRTTPDVALASTAVRYNPADSPGVERAAVQRVFAPAQPTQVGGGARSQRSDSTSSGREKRPLTAGSTTSTVSHKLKGLISRTPADAEHSLSSRMRSSSETSHRSSKSDVVTDDAKSDLDRLIKSNATIHYTLTPRSMREIEVSGFNQVWIVYICPLLIFSPLLFRFLLDLVAGLKRRLTRTALS